MDNTIEENWSQVRECLRNFGVKIGEEIEEDIIKIEREDTLLKEIKEIKKEIIKRKIILRKIRKTFNKIKIKKRKEKKRKKKIQWKKFRNARNRTRNLRSKLRRKESEIIVEEILETDKRDTKKMWELLKKLIPKKERTQKKAIEVVLKKKGRTLQE